MSYKTILVHIDYSRHAAKRIAVAAGLAIAHDAHLIGIAATGVSQFVFQGSELDSSFLIMSQIEMLTKRAADVMAKFERHVQHLGVGSYEACLAEDDAEGGLSLHARYADLVVVGQSDPDEAMPTILSDLPEYAVLHCGRPILIVPYDAQTAADQALDPAPDRRNVVAVQTIGRRVLIAWDGSQEATRAVSNAIPLLKNAPTVTAVVFNPNAMNSKQGEQAGADLATYLARHGIALTLIAQPDTDNIGTALMQLANELEVDVIVIGGFGRSRFRETLLGGVTRTVLKTMTTPLLMSH